MPFFDLNLKSFVSIDPGNELPIATVAQAGKADAEVITSTRIGRTSCGDRSPPLRINCPYLKKIPGRDEALPLKVAKLTSTELQTLFGATTGFFSQVTTRTSGTR
jgi:hypothetical protein